MSFIQSVKEYHIKISEISELWSNIKEYDKILTIFHLEHLFEKDLFLVNMSSGFKQCIHG